MSAALCHRLKAVGAALAAKGRIRLPKGPAANWSNEEKARVIVLVDVCGRALLSRLDEEALVVLAERGRGRDGEAAISPPPSAGTSSPRRCR
jgi:hypothetical protein